MNRDIEQRYQRRHADFILRDTLVYLPTGPERTNVACLDGKIVAIGGDAWTADEIISLRGLHVLPGVIDSQVHFREPGMPQKEDIESGTRGAVLGGVTSIFEMPNTNPLTLYQTDIEDKLSRANGRSWCNYAFYVGGSAANADQLAKLELLSGCAGVKVFMGSSFGDLLSNDDDVLRAILKNGSRRIAIHAEDDSMLKARKHIVDTSKDVKDHPVWRNVDTALSATQRIVSLAREYGRRLHILHISTAEEVEYLSRHRGKVTFEALPHHLTLCSPECYERLGTLAQMNPPIRDSRHRYALWSAVRDGLVDVIGSDHAPHTLAEKDQPYPASPSGMPGVQTLLPVMLSHVNAGRLSLQRLVDLTSAGPARVFGIQGKGRIAIGYDADFTIVNLTARRTISNSWIASRSNWSPYDGMTVTGWPVSTIVGGSFVVRDEELQGAPIGKPISFLESPHPELERVHE